MKYNNGNSGKEQVFQRWAEEVYWGSWDVEDTKSSQHTETPRLLGHQCQREFASSTGYGVNELWNIESVSCGDLEFIRKPLMEKWIDSYKILCMELK